MRPQERLSPAETATQDHTLRKILELAWVGKLFWLQNTAYSQLHPSLFEEIINQTITTTKSRKQQGRKPIINRMSVGRKVVSDVDPDRSKRKYGGATH